MVMRTSPNLPSIFGEDESGQFSEVSILESSVVLLYIGWGVLRSGLYTIYVFETNQTHTHVNPHRRSTSSRCGLEPTPFPSAKPPLWNCCAPSCSCPYLYFRYVYYTVDIYIYIYILSVLYCRGIAHFRTRYWVPVGATDFVVYRLHSEFYPCFKHVARARDV